MPSFAYSIKGTIAKRVYNGIFHVTDWFPTIASLTKMQQKKISALKRLDGVDQSAALTGASAEKMRTEMVYGMIGRRNGI